MNEQSQILTQEFPFSPPFQKVRFLLVVLVVSLSCGAGLLSLSIPKFQEIYSDFGASLPFFTSFVIHAQIGFVLASFLALSAAIATIFFRSSAGLVCTLSTLFILMIAQFITLSAALFIPIFILSGEITS